MFLILFSILNITSTISIISAPGGRGDELAEKAREIPVRFVVTEPETRVCVVTGLPTGTGGGGIGIPLHWGEAQHTHGLSQEQAAVGVAGDVLGTLFVDPQHSVRVHNTIIEQSHEANRYGCAEARSRAFAHGV